MNNIAQSADQWRRRRVILWWLLLLAICSGFILWWGPWRPWDVGIRFLRFEDANGVRKAVFEVANRSTETLLVPKDPRYYTYHVFLTGGGTAEHPGKNTGGWWGVERGRSREVALPLTCPDGTPVTGPFRIGMELSEIRSIRRRESLKPLPGWAKHWIYKVLPKDYFKDRTQTCWSEVVTP